DADRTAEHALYLPGVTALDMGDFAGRDIQGKAAAEFLRGSYFDDTIHGGDGNDTIVGSAGVDILTGGAGRDLFRFPELQDLGRGGAAGKRDVITDFQRGTDKIDFQFLPEDAVYLGNATAFGADATHQVRFDKGVLYFSTDADATAEYALQLTGLAAFTLDDLL
ncbi:MAG TPA: M10 family metallopeptidase C-terminal domain-containing protein, partial [Ramlibacter sp.]